MRGPGLKEIALDLDEDPAQYRLIAPEGHAYGFAPLRVEPFDNDTLKPAMVGLGGQVPRVDTVRGHLRSPAGALR